MTTSKRERLFLCLVGKGRKPRGFGADGRQLARAAQLPSGQGLYLALLGLQLSLGRSNACGFEWKCLSLGARKQRKPMEFSWSPVAKYPSTGWIGDRSVLEIVALENVSET